MSDQHEYQSYLVLWKGQPVGAISKLSQDMWYVDGEWLSSDTLVATEFMNAIAHLTGKTYWNSDPEHYVWVEIPGLSLNCTVVHTPIENRITFRMMLNLKAPEN